MNQGRMHWHVVIVTGVTVVVVLSGLTTVGGLAVGQLLPSTQPDSHTMAPPAHVMSEATNTTTQPGATAWPMAGVNAANTRHLETTGPTKPLTVRWQFKTDDERFTNPVVADGSIFFGGIDRTCNPDPRGVENPKCSDQDEHVYAVDAETGTERWRLSLGNETSVRTPAVVDDTVYVPTTGWLFALDADSGTVRWRTKVPGHFPPPPPVVVDGTAYVGNSGRVFALDSSTGAVRWSREGPGKLAVADGTVYLGAGKEVEARNAQTGDLEWTAEVGGGLGEVAVAQGLVYVGGDDPTTIYALDTQTGDEQWNVHIEGATRTRDVAVAGDTVYFGTPRGKLYAVDAKTGARRWSVSTPDNTPVLVNGTAYVAQGRSVYALNAENGNELARFTVDDPDGKVNSLAPVIDAQATVVDGSLYIGYRFNSGGSSTVNRFNDTRLFALGGSAFSYSNLSVSPEAVAPGEPITLTATVKNTGNAPGTFNATLVVNGSVVSAGEASLNAGAQTIVEFTHVFRKNGTYAIGINHLRQVITIGSTAQATSPTPETPIDQPTPLNGTENGAATGPGSGPGGNGTASETPTPGSTPGFGVGVAVLAVLVVLGVLRRTREGM